MTLSKSQHTLDLVQDLLDDIELGRSSGERLVLKASRLARIVGAEEIREWLRFELGGFSGKNETSLKYMGLTGRWTSKKENKGYWMSLAQIEATIDANKSMLAVMRTPDPSGDYSVAVTIATRAMRETSSSISKFSGIRSKVMARLHLFITDIYYEKVFDNLSESIFESYKRDADSLIYENCADVIDQIPLAMERLASGGSEAISHRSPPQIGYILKLENSGRILLRGDTNEEKPI